ncbi:hypothetical protein ACIBKY_31980 [Nonomuraea sp. NPDC050394]
MIPRVRRDHELKGRASASGQEYKAEISVGDAGKIDYLLITG